ALPVRPRRPLLDAHPLQPAPPGDAQGVLRTGRDGVLRRGLRLAQPADHPAGDRHGLGRGPAVAHPAPVHQRPGGADRGGRRVRGALQLPALPVAARARRGVLRRRPPRPHPPGRPGRRLGDRPPQGGPRPVDAQRQEPEHVLLMNMAAFINGIAVGGVAALLAVGISQIFTTSGVLNFAHAGFAMVAAYLYAWLAATEHWPVGWAALATVVIVSLLGTLAEWLVLRRLADAPFITKVIVTLGLYVFMQGATLQLFGFDP